MGACAAGACAGQTSACEDDCSSPKETQGPGWAETREKAGKRAEVVEASSGLDGAKGEQQVVRDFERARET